MKKVWIGIFIALCCGLGFAQDSKSKADFILTKAKKNSVKKVGPIDGVFIESASKFSVRKEKIKPGIISSYDYGTKLWVQNSYSIKLKKMITYPGNSLQITENTVSDQAVQTNTKVKGPDDSGFFPVMVREKGDPKQNERNLLQKTKYEAFSLSFPIYFFSGEDLSFDYVGVAKSSTQNADVLATSIGENYKINLFFDQKTNLLLMMSAKFIDPKSGEATEHKYFFSDYKEENGINFPHKIVIQENGEVIEERDIKKIELNPKIESDFFALKE